jgi:gliding motility-associated-like protein
MRCFSLAADGSDFTLNSSNVAITGATGLHCNDQFDFDSLQLTLSDTLSPGIYSLTAKGGTDEKNLWDNCFREVPEGDQISFTVPPSGSVAADFSYQIRYGCKNDSIYFQYPVTNGSFHSQWFIDSVFSSSLFEPVIVTSDFGPMQVQHVVSNGYCSDTVSKTVDPGNILKSGIEAPVTACPAVPVTFADNSTGNILSWNWDFGDGTGSNLQNPPAHLFPDKPGENRYQVKLAVENDLGCTDTASASLTRLQTCYTGVPNAFTPNGDGKNDFLFPLNLSSATDMQFLVFNRFGQLVFETRNGARKWDGTINGIAQPTGSYIWTLRYTDGSSGKKIFLRGISVLIR